MATSPFVLKRPDHWSTSLVVASPHSGSHYPDDMLSRTLLGPLALRSSEDMKVDRLCGVASDLGAPLLSATFPRAYLDLNRASDELDPALIEGVSSRGTNPRVASGLGVIPRVVAGGRAIYQGKLSRQEAERRINEIWAPYHDALTQLMQECWARFGEALLLDFHSMPHEAIDSSSRERQSPQIVLGDRYGASADAACLQQVEDAFRAAGFRVARNTPFAGAYIAQTYGRPSRGWHVVQVEIDRALYMDEKTLKMRDDFSVVQQRISEVLARIAGLRRRDEGALAAE